MNARLAATGGVLAAIVVAGGWALLEGGRGRDEAGRRAARGDLAGALALWDEACARDPADVTACVRAGELRYGDGDVEGASRALARAEERAPGDLSVMMLKGALQQKAGDDAGARETYLSARKLHPAAAMPAANLAGQALFAGDAIGAEKWAEEAVAVDPGNAFAQTTHARVLAARGDRDGALDAYTRALEASPHSFDALLETADLLTARGDFPGAARLLERALAQRPDHLEARIAYATNLAQMGQDARAAELLRAAAELDPSAPAPHLALGELYLATGKGDFAVGRFREALVLDTSHVLARQRLAEALHVSGAFAESAAVLDGLIARHDLSKEQMVETRMLRADLRWRRSLPEAAHEDLKAVLALDPKHEQANWLTGHMLLDARRYEEARPFVQAALVPQPPHRAAILDHARLLAQSGKKAEAITELSTLERLGQLSIPEVKAQPEFGALKDERDFLLLLEQASESESESTP